MVIRSVAIPAQSLTPTSKHKEELRMLDCYTKLPAQDLII
jgi:hypothetical protein